MNSHANKTQENKNNVVQKRSNNNRALDLSLQHQTAAQTPLQNTANNSKQVKQALQLQAVANANSSLPIQKKGIEEEELQMKSIPVQRQSIKEEEPLQKKENSTGLPDNLKSGIENLSGYSMDDVKVHYNSDKPAQLQAHAYAQGTDIHIASGQEKHLPHEAWHVVQQKQGRVQPTLQMKGNVNVNDDAGLENEADVMGQNAFQFVYNQSEPAKNNDSEIPSTKGFSTSRENVAQLLKVSDDHVRGDLRHKVGETLFEDYTLKDIEKRTGRPISQVSNQILDEAVKESRADEMMDYAHLSKEKVTSEKQLSQYLDKSPDDEHMYVLQNSELHVAIRADDKKLPHPTLVGGDPDVECAGTMRRNSNDDVVVTASSGHFRPPSERPGQKAVDKIMEKTASSKYSKKVKGSKR